jgi:hypothetical protein
MAITNTYDYTTQFNANSGVVIDMGGWDNVTVQLVSPSGAVSFNTTNDAGAITGISDGGAASATNYTAIQGINLATGSGVTSLNATGSVRFNNVGKYLQLTGSSVTATKVIAFFTNI